MTTSPIPFFTKQPGSLISGRFAGGQWPAIRRIVLVAALISGSLRVTASDTLRLKAGAATSNITPKLGAGIVGGFAPYPALHVHDELHARCLVLDDGTTKVALVVCDLLGLHRSVSLEARRLIQEATGIPPAQVLISATHTHSAASAMGKERFVSDQPLDDYQRFVARRIADGVHRAVTLLRPAQIGFGTAEAPDHLFNRRWFLRDGTMPPNPFGKLDRVKMNPRPGSPDLVKPAGPTDPTISFIALREPAGRLISVFAAYSLHYVGDTANGDISADYYGVFCATLAKLQPDADEDPPFVAMMANGTSGDINNISFPKPRPSQPPYQHMRQLAGDLAGKVNTAIGNVAWKDSVALVARYREAEISWRRIDDDLRTWAKEAKSKPPSASGTESLSYFYAERVMELAQASQPALAPLQVLRLGDICIGVSPCETFAEIGLEFKKRSPFAKSFMVSLGHTYLGYLPTPRHFELGGYETWPGTNYLEPQASVKIMDALLEMAKETRGSPR